jgi:hypothetical protein
VISYLMKTKINSEVEYIYEEDPYIYEKRCFLEKGYQNVKIPLYVLYSTLEKRPDGNYVKVS